MSDLRIAFIGAGQVADLHARAIDAIPGLTLCGFTARSERTRVGRSQEWKVPAYASARELLRDGGADAILVLTHTDSHLQYAEMALEAGKHVLIEKPVAATHDIARLRGIATDLVCMPGHNYAYQPEFRAMLNRVHAGDFGEIRAAWITFAIKHEERVLDGYGDVLDEVLLHHAYLAIALFGPPIGITCGLHEGRWPARRLADQGWMTWRYAATSVHMFASLAVDDDTFDPWTFTVKVLGTHGGETYSWRNAIIKRPLGTLSVGLPAYEDSYVHELEAFKAAIEGDRSAIVSDLAAAEKVARLLDEARANALWDAR